MIAQVLPSVMDLAPMPRSRSATMSATDFSGLIELVPDLLTFLTQSTKKALMSSNRAFRNQIQQTTTSIKFDADDEADVLLLVSKHRPYLRHLDLSSAVIMSWDCSKKALVSLGQWPCLTSLNLSTLAMFRRETATSLDLAQLHWPMLAVLSLGGTDMALNQWRELGQNGLPYLRTLGLSDCGADAAGLAELIQGNFPLLQTLDLAASRAIDMRCILLLISAKWPHLKKLDLSFNKLDDEHIAQLAKGKWPQLEVLNLSHNIKLTAHAINLVRKANWPLMNSVGLHGLPLDYVDD